MNQFIIKELVNRGFFESNGVLSKFIGPNQYIIDEDQDTVTVERSFDGDDNAKNAGLDYIQLLAGRYALTSAYIRSGRLRVALTKPSANAREEALRIDFLIQSIDAGLAELVRNFEAVDSPLDPITSLIEAEEQALLDETAFNNDRQIKPNRFADPGPIATSLGETLKEPYRREEMIVADVYDDEIIDEDEYYKYKTTLTKQPEVTARSRVEKDRARQERPRNRNSYVPQATNHSNRNAPQPVYATVIDRRFSVIGFFGAGIGAILGAILMGVLRTMGYPAQPAAILIPFLVIGIYRLIAGYQMPIWLGVSFVLASILMGSVLVTTTDVLALNGVGFLTAFKRGIMAHVDNTNYYVVNVWLKIGVSVLAASIPTMLLLAGGKRKTKVY